ncbi:MAG: hypothetical protein M3R39_07515 [Actinomycetota bacterium]|nr:hypothetical protein [Actinomycetota bacterium]
MKISSTAHRIAAVLAAIAALTVVSGVAQAATSKPAGMSKAEYRALVLRSEALNQKYRLGEWKGVPQGMTPAEYRALMTRSEALNKKYGLGKWSTATAARTPTGSTHGFAWAAFGIGAVAMLGLVLLGAGLIVGSRHTRRAPRIRTS